jgi:hypothetical protein
MLVIKNEKEAKRGNCSMLTYYTVCTEKGLWQILANIG